MTDIIFSFDTEDFTSREAADGILNEAEILRTAGVRGCFCLVGLLAQQLQRWGRRDVLEALSHHEIALHTYGHTLHPMINEYTDIADADTAIAEVVRQETEALRLIEAATGVKRVYAAVPPGNQKSYAAMYAYADMGIPIYADTFCDPHDGRGAYYCNVFHTGYIFPMESMFFKCGEAELRAKLDSLAERRRAVIYTHPHYSLFSEWWDIVNYDKRNLYEFGAWKPCKKRPPEETERFYDNLRLLLRLIKEDDRFNIITYSQLAEELAARPERHITRAEIPALRESLSAGPFPVDSPLSLSISDVFLACRDLLRGKREHICGRVYGFLDKPVGITEDVTLNASDIIRSAGGLDADRFLPSVIPVGDTIIGAFDWLTAALGVLCGEERVTLKPQAQLPCLDTLPQLRDCSFRGTWRHSDDFRDEYLSDRLRLQSWTLRF